jgi:hypothetical protein
MEHPNDFALAVGCHIVFGVDHKLVSAHTDVAARAIDFAALLNDQQPTGFTGKLFGGVGQGQGLIDFIHAVITFMF